jgi:hypothetical protein
MSGIGPDVIAKLEAAVLTASPAMRPLAQVTLQLAKSAAAEIDAANKRADLAEQTMRSMLPTVDEIGEQLVKAETELADERRVVADLTKRERVQKAEAAEEAAVAAALPALERAMKTLETSFEKSVDVLTAIVKLTRGPDGRNALRCKQQYGEWCVLDPDSGRIAVCESRADAIALVRSLVERQYATMKDVASEIGSPRVHHDLDEKKPRKYPDVGADMGFSDSYDARSKSEDRSDLDADRASGHLDGRKLRTKRQIKKGYLT